MSVADLGISWTVRKTSEWVFETTGVGRSLKQWKLSYFEHVLWKSEDRSPVEGGYTCKAQFLDQELKKDL